MKSRPRIVVDARPLTHPQPGGFRSHVRALTQGLREIAFDEEAELIFYVDRPPTTEQRRLLPSGASFRVLTTNRLRADFLRFPGQVRRDAPDLVHGTVNYLPPNLPARMTLTMHDALGLRPDIRGKSFRQRALESYWAALSRSSVRRAARRITVSHHAAAELSQALGLPQSDFSVVYNGLALPAVHGRKSRASRSVLAFASADGRKNWMLVSAWMRQWDEENMPLITFVATSEAVTKKVKDQTKGYPFVRILTRPDDETIACLYSRASVFVFPSTAEGFGLPPLEAMAMGCPVVSSSAAAMPEILSDIPLYFDPSDVRELTARMKEIEADAEATAARTARGRTHAATFTCLRMAEETAAVWRKALS